MNPSSIVPITRRSMLQRSAAGFGFLALQGLLGREQAHAAANSPILNPLAPKAPHFPAKAKRIVFLFMKGGPSHVDTFDPNRSSSATTASPTPSNNPASSSPKPANS